MCLLFMVSNTSSWGIPAVAYLKLVNPVSTMCGLGIPDLHLQDCVGFGGGSTHSVWAVGLLINSQDKGLT